MSDQGPRACDALVVVYKDVQMFSPIRCEKVSVDEANEDCVDVNTYIVNFQGLSEDTKDKLSSYGIGKKPYIELQDLSPKTVDNIKKIREMTGGSASADDGRKKKKKRQTDIEEINMLQGYKGPSPADGYRSQLELHAVLGDAIRSAHIGRDTDTMPIVNGRISVVHVCHRWIDDV